MLNIDGVLQCIKQHPFEDCAFITKHDTKVYYYHNHDYPDCYILVPTLGFDSPDIKDIRMFSTLRKAMKAANKTKIEGHYAYYEITGIKR